MQNSADLEKLGAFYLGREHDPAGGDANSDLLLYDAKDLTTHALMVGMTGSGKTGLATALIEEAALDGIPAILIDPKGDLGNLLLQFPDLEPGNFRPWIDESEALRKGLTPDELAARTAATWRKGLADWGQDGGRIRRLQESAEISIYTPGYAAGRPLQVLRSFAAPPPGAANDPSALRERIMGAVSSLMSLMGMEADPIQSREHILLSTILGHAWGAGRSLDLPAIIHDVQKPPFDKVGVFDLESFYPAKERFGLAMRLNNVIASPGFAAWMEGEPLDIRRLLHTPAGRPRVSILYLAHLSDTERMFFVTLLLNEVISWMRAQTGTGSLRALLYMDEIFGYFPPNGNPPSKTPMLTLLKQARAFGLGVVLSTQNPVDLDYKGLSNCGTWFIGRLQTERDKLRVMEGLEGAALSAGAGFDRARTEQLLAGLGQRIFLMRNVHDEDHVLFQTRWAMSYLRGPMTLPQIVPFAAEQAAATPPPGAAAGAPVPQPASAAPMPAGTAGTAGVAGAAGTPGTAGMAGAGAAPAVSAAPPPAGPGVPVLFRRPQNPAGAIIYSPAVVGACKLHFVDATSKLDTWVSRASLAPLAEDGRSALWEEAQECETLADFDNDPLPSSTFLPLPAGATNAANFAAMEREFKSALYQQATLDLLTYPEPKLASRPDEDEGDFRVRVAQALREERDTAVAKLSAKYATRKQTLDDRLRRANERVERERSHAGQQTLNTAVSLGATLLGLFLGGGRSRIGTVGRASTTLKSAGRIGKKKADAERAEDNVEVLQQQAEEMAAQFEQEVAPLKAHISPEELEIERRSIRPRKSDIKVDTVALCWVAR